MSDPVTVCYVITGLDTGGAEKVLLRLLARCEATRLAPSVISLTTVGEVGERIRELGIPVEALGMRRGTPNPVAMFRLARRLRAHPPHIVQTWMYHADLVGGVAAYLSRIPVIWGIRHGTLDPRRNKRLTVWTARTCARLSSRIPAAIVCCSEASRRHHEALGYDAGKMVVVPNGFDAAVFKPDPAARARLRGELDVPGRSILIGMVARFDPQKEHRTFVAAAAGLVKDHRDVVFLLCGEGMDAQNKRLSGWLEEHGLAGHFRLLGPRQDIPAINAALDIATLSSSGEGFPNVIGEAMACAVPCVATDVGEMGRIIGETGILVRPRDPQALADGWRRAIEAGGEQRAAWGAAARQRIREHYDLGDIARRYTRLYADIHAARAA